MLVLHFLGKQNSSKRRSFCRVNIDGIRFSVCEILAYQTWRIRHQYSTLWSAHTQKPILSNTSCSKWCTLSQDALEVSRTRSFVHFFAVTARLQTFLFFSWTLIQSFRIQLQKICQHLTNKTSWNKRGKVWSSAKSLFKWRFRNRRRRRGLSGEETTTFFHQKLSFSMSVP